MNFVLQYAERSFLTGTVHLLDISENISKGLALWFPSEWVPFPKLTPRPSLFLHLTSLNDDSSSSGR